MALAKGLLGVVSPAILVVATSCSLTVSLDGLSTPGADSGDGGVTDAGVNGEAGGGDAMSLEGGAEDAGIYDSTCVGTAGAPMVRVASNVCIDATEVTNDQYAAFLSAHGNTPKGGELPGVCSFKISLVPDNWPQPSKGDVPVIKVDWCDAWAYCKAVGKHLCGAIGGGAVNKNDASNAGVDAWYRACSLGGARVYPYEGAFDGTRCNGPTAGRSGPSPVGGFAKCEGASPGLFDMSGNVQEWEDSCDSSNGKTDRCADRGGGWIYYDASQEIERMKCTYRDTFTRDARVDNLGIRCCSE